MKTSIRFLIPIFIALAAITIRSFDTVASPDDLRKACAVAPAYIYTLRVQLPEEITLNEALCGVYKGKLLEFDKTWALIPEEQSSVTFSLIITPEIGFKREGNNIRYIHRLDNTPFRWYDLTLRKKTKMNIAQSPYCWEIKELSSEEAPNKIPDHAVVVFMNPDLIDGLKDSCITDDEQDEQEINMQQRVIALPTIVVKETATQNEFDESCINAQLASTDLRTIHTKRSPETKKDQLAVMAICNN